MVKNIVDLLQTNDFYNQSERIDIAKGRYELPTTWSGMFKLIK
jgi:hypothetical protein